jgi:hypothetical protein
VKQTNHRIRRVVGRLAAATALVVAVLAVTAPAGWAAFGFETWTTTLDGPQAVQAGGHADLTTEFEFTALPPDPGFVPLPEGDLKRLVADLPPGQLGDPNATPKCSQFDFLNISRVLNLSEGCAAASQVGVAEVTLGRALAAQFPVTVPVYNMEPRNGGETARLAFYVPAVNVPIQIGLRVRSESDYGITAISDGLTRFYPVASVRMTLWSSPGDASHDSSRYPQVLGDGRAFCGFVCVGPPPLPFPLSPNPGLPPRAFLTNPTSCDGPLISRVSAISYQEPDTSVGAEHTMPTMSGCDLVPFEPVLSIEPRSRLVDSPTGLDVELTLPPSTDPNLPAQSHLRHARVTLPEGVSINPSAAHGLTACTDAQLKLGTREPADCPDAARVGTVEIESPPLPGDNMLRGGVYQRPQLPGETFRVVIVAEGHGVSAKIPGVVRPDHTTGQIVSLFEETPQVPFTKMTVRFDGGDRAALATPPRCGTFTTTGIFTPWSGQADAVRNTAFDASWDGAGAACPAQLPFDPTVSVGSRSNVAGATSAFVLRIQRGDRNQELRSTTVETPRGLSAYLKGVEICKAAQADAGTCSEATRVGTTTSGAGAGSHPFYLGGKVFLTEGYKGGAYGLSIVVPAVAGPFDLGDVIVRAAIHVDRRDATLRVVSDPIPRIIEGVPLRVRDIRVVMDRPRFTVNPTSCDPQQIVTKLESYDGTVATRTNRMKMSDCASLGFKPRLAMRLTGRKQRRTGGHPGVRAVVKQAAGQAGIKRVVARLPRTLALDPDNAQALCEYEEGIKDEPNCPKGSIVGRARAVSPLLNRPLVGNVYFVKNVRIDPRTGNRIRTLPMIVLALRGEIAINLRGEASTKKDGTLVSTFSGVPDAPISRFKLNIGGGQNGILVVTRNRRSKLDLCDGPQVLEADIDGHNGRRYDRDVKVKTPCPKPKKGRGTTRK